jgi:hypothetical protein
MPDQRELWPDGVFELIWHQHNPDDWMADVRDTRTNQHCQVYTLAELEQFIRTHLQIPEPRPSEVKRNRRG